MAHEAPIKDGSSAWKLFSDEVSYTYNDIILHPNYIDFSADDVDLSTRNIPLSLPIVSSPMDTVTEASMALSLASLGGIGIIHSNNSPSHQASLVRSVKCRRIPDPVFVAPNATVADFAGAEYLLVTDGGDPRSKLLGVLPGSEWKQGRLASDCMWRRFAAASSSSDFEEVAAAMAEEGVDFLPLLADGGEAVGVVTKADVDRIKGFPRSGRPSIGPDGKLMVGAAIGTREEDKVRLEHLVKEGVNVVVLDSSQAISIYQLDMIKYVKRTYPDVDVIGGNVVTVNQTENLINAGVDGLRVGMRPGSICTTQQVCGLGRGQVN